MKSRLPAPHFSEQSLCEGGASQMEMQDSKTCRRGLVLNPSPLQKARTAPSLRDASTNSTSQFRRSAGINSAASLASRLVPSPSKASLHAARCCPRLSDSSHVHSAITPRCLRHLPDDLPRESRDIEESTTMSSSRRLRGYSTARAHAAGSFHSAPPVVEPRYGRAASTARHIGRPQASGPPR